MSFETLVRGLEAFQEHDHKQNQAFYAELSSGQSPSTAMVACADSRLDPYRLTSARPGDLFLIKNAGNFVPPCTSASVDSTVASLEFAVKALGVEHIVICGHSDCGAMKALKAGQKIEAMPDVDAWIGSFSPAEVSAGADLPAFTKAQIAAQIESAKAHPFIAEGLANGSLTVHGWYYDIASGAVEAFDAKSGNFVAAQALYKET